VRHGDNEVRLQALHNPPVNPCFQDRTVTSAGDSFLGIMMNKCATKSFWFTLLPHQLDSWVVIQIGNQSAWHLGGGGDCDFLLPGLGDHTVRIPTVEISHEQPITAVSSLHNDMTLIFLYIFFRSLFTFFFFVHSHFSS
jgi:hypothetical protein